MHAVIEATDSNFNHYWSELFANDPLQNPFYSPQTRACLNKTRSDLGFINRSFVIIDSDKPVFACSLTMHIDDSGKKCLGYFGFEASTHVNRMSMESTSNNFRPESVFLLQQHINQLIEEIQPDSLEYLDPVSCGMMSPVTQVLLEKGARPIVQTAKIIDLSKSLPELQRNIHKPKRALIYWGQRHLVLERISGASFEDTAAQSLAHIFDEAITSGTSPCSSLQTYEQLIRQDKAFLVQGTRAGKTESCALFLHADRTCHFVFGSSLPQSEERPLLHALIWEAIQYSKKIGCTQFEIGRMAKTDDVKSSRTQLLNDFGADSQTRLKLCLIAN